MERPPVRANATKGRVEQLPQSMDDCLHPTHARHLVIVHSMPLPDSSNGLEASMIGYGKTPNILNTKRSEVGTIKKNTTN